MKKARILNSEAFKSEQVNQATGEAQALIWKAKAQATSVEVISQALSQQVSIVSFIALDKRGIT